MNYYEYSPHNRIKAQLYNNNLPHYQVANAYFNDEKDDFLSFLTDTNKVSPDFEASHNCIHNYNHYLMKDANFSICNLVFFAYHSYIDMALELKIREVATLKYKHTK